MDANVILDFIILLAVGLVYFLLNKSIPSYFSEKGKNLATKQDIGDITDKIESVKKIYQSEIEELKSSLAKEREITTLALQARNISIGSFSSQKGVAIQKMWDLMITLRDSSAFELTQSEFIQHSPTYEKEVFNPNFRDSSEAKSVDIVKISSEMNTAFRELRKDRVWLGQSLWGKFTSYVSIISIIRFEFHKYLKEGGNLDLSNSDSLIELLSEFYSKELINEYDLLKNFSSISVILNALETQILNEVNDIQSGKTAAKDTLDHAAKIERAKRKFT
jgi:hypothetical protein